MPYQRTIASLKDPLEVGQRVRLVGLQGAAHLNGNAGRVKREDPKTQGQVGPCLAGGRPPYKISVKGDDLERV